MISKENNIWHSTCANFELRVPKYSCKSRNPICISVIDHYCFHFVGTARQKKYIKKVAESREKSPLAKRYMFSILFVA